MQTNSQLKKAFSTMATMLAMVVRFPCCSKARNAKSCWPTRKGTMLGAMPIRNWLNEARTSG